MSLAALLLDVDNTLVDRAAAYEQYADRLIAAAGVPADRRAELIAIDQGCYRPRRLWAPATLAALPELGWSVDQLRADFESVLPTLLPEPAALKELLARLRPHVRLVACTNGPSGLQRAKLAATGLDTLLDGIVVSGELGRDKPDRAMFDAALHAAGCTPDTALMVGDNPREDIAGAQAIGLRGVWVDAPWRRFVGPPPDGLEPHIVVPDTASFLARLAGAPLA